MELFGIRLIGASQDTAAKLLLSVAIIAAVLAARVVIAALARVITGRDPLNRALFWTRQGSSLTAAVLLLVALLSIWFDNPAQLGSIAGVVTAGLAIAAQRAVTAFAGYLVIMRGKTFTVGDRIKMGGVRGDVVDLGFLQTRLLEMGQPPEVNAQEDPGMWVRARQFSGRVVTVTNDKVFDEPVYNFTREFPFIWEEMHVPVPYRADRRVAERILLDAAREATADTAGASDAARRTIQARYGIELDSHEPRVYWRLTDNWVELTIRFVVPEHGIRPIKDQITRRVLEAFEAAGIEIGSTTLEITRVPPLEWRRAPRAGA